MKAILSLIQADKHARKVSIADGDSLNGVETLESEFSE